MTTCEKKATCLRLKTAVFKEYWPDICGTGSESFDEWASLLDDHLAEITAAVPTGLGQQKLSG